MAPPFYDHAGRTLDGRYELIARVGAGAFATVYRAKDRNVHDRVVAVKVLHPERASDPSTVQRFLREVKLAVRITGKHRDRLVQILDQGYCEAEAPGLLYFVMEFVEGPTLQRLLAQAPGGLFAWRRAVALGYEVAQALVALHGHGVVHRDIKPGNCILEDDRVRLLDLGIAKLVPDLESSGVVRLTQPNMIVGTLRYMAPEQYAGHGCDARADVYAVGVMLYEFLTGSGPVFREVKEHPAINKPLGLVPPSLTAPGRGIPAAVDAVVVQALQWRPEDRFQSAEALVAALAATMTSDPTNEWIRRPRSLPAHQRRLFAAAHALGLWTLLAGTTVAAVSLAAGVSLAHGEGEAPPAALERDDSPAVSEPARVASVEPAGSESPTFGADVEPAGSESPTFGASVESAGSESPTFGASVGSAGSESPTLGASVGPAGSESPTLGASVEPAGSESPTLGANIESAGSESSTNGASVGPADIDPSVKTAGEEQDAPPIAAPEGPAALEGGVRVADEAKEAPVTQPPRPDLPRLFAARKKQAIAACGPLCGLTDPRGLVARVRVQVQAGKVGARALAPWRGTPLGDCLEGQARTVAAADRSGEYTWTLKF